MAKPKKLAYLYSLASVFIGPSLVLYSFSRHPSGGDCLDPSWDQDGMPSVQYATREAIYDANAQVMVIGAYIMLIIGAGLLGWLIYTSIKNKDMLAGALLALLITFMLAGYLAILAIAASPWC